MKVDDPARGADEDVCACLERVYLPCRVDAPHDAADAAIQAFGDGAADSFDLLGKFPGGGEDEKAGPFLGVRGRLERVHQGKGEGERLSRPGLRAGDDVASLDRFRDGLFLYGRGLVKPSFETASRARSERFSRAKSAIWSSSSRVIPTGEKCIRDRVQNPFATDPRRAV